MDGLTTPPGAKFSDPVWTAKGERRARVALTRLETLWINTGTLCNLACDHCYIESTPRNDALIHITAADAKRFMDEAAGMGAVEVGFTGGEPFVNPDIIAMIADALELGFRVLVLTNAMTPMRHHRAALLELRTHHPGRMTIRVSIDHPTAERHEELRGPRSWSPTLEGVDWLAEHGFDVAIAARNHWGEAENDLRAGFEALFDARGWGIEAADPARLVIFPEMDVSVEVPEITEACWDILHKSPDSVMCASARMVVHRKGEAAPRVVACTLLPHDPGFDLGDTLARALGPVSLNHRHCAKFCVLGGASCSPAKG